MESIEDFKLMMGPDAEQELPHFSHFSWCTLRLREDCKIAVSDLEIVYKTLVLDEGKTDESYMKFFYCLVEYVRSVHPFESWIKENSDQSQWIEFIMQAGAKAAEFEDDKEKWIEEFKEHLKLNPVPSVLDDVEAPQE